MKKISFFIMLAISLPLGLAFSLPTPSFLTMRYDQILNPSACPISLVKFFSEGHSIAAIYDMRQAPTQPGKDGIAVLTTASSENFQASQPLTLFNEGLSNKIGLMSNGSIPVTITIDGLPQPFELDRAFLLGIPDHFTSGMIINKQCDVYGMQ